MGWTICPSHNVCQQHRSTLQNCALYNKTCGSATNSLRTTTKCGSKATSATCYQTFSCKRWIRQEQQHNLQMAVLHQLRSQVITGEISFCFMSFHLTGNIPLMNYACNPEELLYLYTTTHMDVLPPTGTGQLLSHLRATHPLLICTLQHKTGGCDVRPTSNIQQLAIFLCTTALVLVQLAPYQVNGWQNAPPTSTLLAWHKIKAADTTVTPWTVQTPFHPTLLQEQQLPALIIVLFHSEYSFFGIFNNV